MKVKKINERNIAWKQFQKYFKQKYLSDRYYDDKIKEFHELRLGQQTMEECNTPVLTPFAFKVHDAINRGEELKEKAPPLIWLCMFRQ